MANAKYCKKQQRSIIRYLINKYDIMPTNKCLKYITEIECDINIFNFIVQFMNFD